MVSMLTSMLTSMLQQVFLAGCNTMIKLSKTPRSHIALEYKQAKYTSNAQNLCNQILRKLKAVYDSNGFQLSISRMSILRRHPTSRSETEVFISP
jgi:hypothetical protein